MMTRRPRSKQRWPVGGEELYELIREAHEPQAIYVRRADQTDRGRLSRDKPDILVYQADADPMLYFWPVENQCVIVQWDHDASNEDEARMVKALLRDGATWVITSRRLREPVDEFDINYRWETHGDPAKWYTDRGKEAPT